MTAPDNIAEIALNLIVTAGFAQIRALGTDPQIVSEYAEAMLGGAIFPAVTLFHDGSTYHAGDGFHRIDAARKIGRDTILAEVRQGTQRDAILFAVGANASHGLRRTQADRRNSVLTLLRDPEWSRMSDRKIGEACRVDHKTVAKIKRELTGDGEFPSSAKAQSALGSAARHDQPSEGMGNSPAASMVERMLSKVADEMLIAEAARRGMELRR